MPPTNSLSRLISAAAARAAAGDDQNRVVAGDGADRLGEPRAVERFGERLRLAAAGADDHELLDALDVADELRRRRARAR